MIYVPISEKELKNDDVISALSTLHDFELVSSPEFNEPTHYEAIIKNRLKCIKKASDRGEEFCCMSNSRTHHLMRGNEEVMRLFLIKHPEYGGVGLFPGKKRKTKGKHILLDCFMVRTDLVKGWNWVIESKGKACDCKRLGIYIRNQGYKFEYLSQFGGRIK